MSDFLKITDEDIKYNLLHLKQLVFEVTDACNLRCKYCGYSELYEGYDQRENLMFPWERAKFILDYLYNIWKNNEIQHNHEGITIGFYGGEPLLNFSFIKQVVEYIQGLPFIGKQYYFNMTTNAMLLDRYMDFLVENEFRLLISLDGDELGQSYRIDANGHNSFGQVFKNIQLLRSEYPDYFDCWVNFNSVIHDRNSVGSVYKFIKDNFGKETRLAPLNNSGIRKDKKKEFCNIYRGISSSIESTKDSEALKKELFINNPMTNALLSYIHDRSGNVFENYNDLFFNKHSLPSIPTGTCLPFAKKMFITVKGRILQCEKINHNFALGQVNERGVDLDLSDAASQHNKYVFKYLDQCKLCALNGFCSQCVFQIDDIDESGSVCKNFCSDKQLEKNIHSMMRYLDANPELYRRLLKEVVIK